MQFPARQAKRQGMLEFVIGDADQRIREKLAEQRLDAAEEKPPPAAQRRIHGAEGMRGIDPRRVGPGRRRRASAPAFELWPWMMSNRGPAFRMRRICRHALRSEGRGSASCDRMHGRDRQGLQFADKTFLGSDGRIDGLHLVAARGKAAAEIEKMPAGAAAARFEELKNTQSPVPFSGRQRGPAARGADIQALPCPRECRAAYRNGASDRCR